MTPEAREPMIQLKATATRPPKKLELRRRLLRSLSDQPVRLETVCALTCGGTDISFCCCCISQTCAP